jgi:hypothetical protein
LLAVVQFPIIGVDFLRHYGLLVDQAGNRLVDRLTLQAFSSSPLGIPPQIASALVHQSTLTVLSGGFPASPLLTCPSMSSLASTATCGKQGSAAEVPHVKVPSGSCGTPFKAIKQANTNAVSGILDEFPDVVKAGKALPDPVHDVEHHIMTTGPPITAIFWRLEGDKLEAARH